MTAAGTLSYLVELNVHEESTLGEILAEAVQRFPGQSPQDLRKQIANHLHAAAHAGQIEFYCYDSEMNIVEVSLERGLSELSNDLAWTWPGPSNAMRINRAPPNSPLQSTPDGAPDRQR